MIIEVHMINNLRFLILILLTLMFTSCSQERTKPLYTVKLSDEGVGKIKVTTPFEMRLIEPKFPGFEIDKFTFFKEGEPFSVIQIGYRETPWMLLYPTKDKKNIESIAVLTSSIESVWPTKIGMRFDETYQTEQLHLCEAGSEDLEGKVICPEPSSKRIRYVYSGKSMALMGELPNYEELRSWHVDEIIWRGK